PRPEERALRPGAKQLGHRWDMIDVTDGGRKSPIELVELVGRPLVGRGGDDTGVERQHQWSLLPLGKPLDLMPQPIQFTICEHPVILNSAVFQQAPPDAGRPAVRVAELDQTYRTPVRDDG